MEEVQLQLVKDRKEKEDQIRRSPDYLAAQEFMGEADGRARLEKNIAYLTRQINATYETTGFRGKMDPDAQEQVMGINTRLTAYELALADKSRISENGRTN